jgi:hypothetical protein
MSTSSPAGRLEALAERAVLSVATHGHVGERALFAAIMGAELGPDEDEARAVVTFAVLRGFIEPVEVERVVPTPKGSWRITLLQYRLTKNEERLREAFGVIGRPR